MRLAIVRNDGTAPADLMERIWRHRHSVFVNALGWEAIRRSDGREIDQFDGNCAIHFAVVRECGTIASYSRLLPSTQPHLMTYLFPNIVSDRVFSTAPSTYEWTRCSRLPKRSKGKFIYSTSTKILYVGMIEYCTRMGIVSLAAIVRPPVLMVLTEIGCDVKCLARPSHIDGIPMVPAVARVTNRSLEVCRTRFGIHRSILPERLPVPYDGNALRAHPALG